jgi:ABC-type sugar transport system ATPase subunit
MHSSWEHRILDRMSQTELRDAPSGRAAPAASMSHSTLAICARGLSKRYGATLALDALDLSVAPGEAYGYLGPNGAGKTTTIRLLLGLHRPSAGSRAQAAVDRHRTCLNGTQAAQTNGASL